MKRTLHWPDSGESRSRAHSALGLSAAVLAIYLLHAWLLLDLVARTPIAAGGAAIGIVAVAALGLGLLDLPLVGTMLAAPIRTVARFPSAFAIMVLSLVLPVAVLEAHPVLTPWPGALASCVGMGVLLAQIPAPRRLFREIQDLASDPTSAAGRSGETVYGFLRGVEQPAPAEEVPDDELLLRRWDRGDSRGRKDLVFNAAGWFVAWVCLFAVLQLSTLFRSIDLLVPGAFLDSPPGSWSQLSWIGYTVETFLLQGELGFEVYEVYGADAPGLLGLDSIQAGRGLSLITISAHLGLVVLLADVVFAHFTVVGHVRRLLDRTAFARFEHRLADPPYLALRVLRPLVEPILLRRLRMGDHSQLSLLGASLLRSSRGRRLQRQLLAEADPFQLRLAAFSSLRASGTDKTGGEIGPEEALKLWAELDCDPADPMFASRISTLCWLTPPGPVDSATAVQAWCFDVMTIATALGVDIEGVESLLSGVDESLPVYRVVRAAIEGSRRAFIELVAEVPGEPEALSRAFKAVLPKDDFSLGKADLKLVRRLHDLSAGTLVEQETAAQWLQPRRLGSIPRDLVSDMLLRRIEETTPDRVPHALLRGLARVGVGSRAVTTLLQAWSREARTDQWADLLAGLTEIGQGDAQVTTALKEALEARDAHRGSREPPTDLIRWVLWRALCTQVSPAVFEALFGRSIKTTSLGQRLWEVPSGDAVIERQTISLPQFWVAESPVAQSEWQQFTNESGAGKPRDSLAPRRCPGTSASVVRVTWLQARAFCAWLTARERANGWLRRDWALRLPTEAEWQRAALGGRRGPYWFGEQFDPRLVRCRTEAEAEEVPGLLTREAGAFRNDWGLADTLGDVWEWCLNDYPSTAVNSPGPPGSRGQRALRGGAWCSGVEACSAWVRSGWEPEAALDHVGFRVVLGPSFEPGGR